MDHFGIGAALVGMFETYVRCSRGSGRTTSLLDSVKDGDCVGFTNQQQANTFKRLTVERGIDVDCVVVPIIHPSEIFRYGTPSGRFILDHVWIEEYFAAAMKRAIADVDHIQTQASGRGEAHRATDRAMREMARWR